MYILMFILNKPQRGRQQSALIYYFTLHTLISYISTNKSYYSNFRVFSCFSSSKPFHKKVKNDPQITYGTSGDWGVKKQFFQPNLFECAARLPEALLFFTASVVENISS